MQYNQPYGVTDVNAPYINGNPTTGQMGSIPPAASIEYPQREIVNLISDANIQAPSNADLHQLARAVQSGRLNFAHDTGTTNALACNLSPPLLSYNEGLAVVLKIANTNSGPAVLNVNGLGNKPIIRYDGTPFTGGELKTGMLACLFYDGVQFQHVWPATYTVGGLVFLAASRDYYVNDATGNDSTMDGLTPATPFKTIQRAVTQTTKFNLNGFSITVHVADSQNYTGQVILPPINGSGAVYITGNTAAPQNVYLSCAAGSAFLLTGGPYVIDGFKITAPNLSGGDPGAGILVSSPGDCVLGAIQFNACRAAHVESSGQCFINGPISINGGAFCHLMAEQSGRVALNPLNKPNVSILQPVAFSTGYVFSTLLGVFYGSYNTITGAGNVTGPKYFADMNGIIQTLGKGAGYFPGTVAGSVATGGQYG